MTTRARAAAIALGFCAGLSPPLSVERLNAEWLAVAAGGFGAGQAATEVALVLIDTRAAAHPEFAAHARAYWATPLASVVDRLLDAGAATVAMDFVLTRAGTLDPAWLATLRRGSHRGRIVLGGAAGAWPAGPQPAAAGGIDALAAVNLPHGDDRIVRSVPVTNGPLPTLAAAAARRAGAEPTRPASLTRSRLPRFVTWSAAAVIDCGEPGRLVEAFAGRVVFVGAWLPHEDRHASPLRSLPAHARTLESDRCGKAPVRLVAEDPVPGVLLHALAADDWLQEQGRGVPGSATTAGVTAGAAFAGVTAATSRRLIWFVFGIAVATAISVMAFAYGWLLPWLGSSVASLTAAAVTLVADNARYAWRFAAGLPRRFRADPGRATVQRLTACFIDIESFTRTSERLSDPARLGRELGRCLTTLGRITEAHGGFVDKYIGDALLVLFGPERGGDGRAEAVAAVGACLAACSGPAPLRLCDRPVRLRIGLACGDARVGPLGESARIHFTAIGDAVNVAARLEQLNRSLGTRVLADASVAEATPGGHWRERGHHELRGRAAPVQVFELVRMPTVPNTCNPYNRHHARPFRSDIRHPDDPGRPCGSG